MPRRRTLWQECVSALEELNRPRHYRELEQKIRERGLFHTSAKDLGPSLRSVLNKKREYFIPYGEGRFGLRPDNEQESYKVLPAGETHHPIPHSVARVLKRRAEEELRGNMRSHLKNMSEQSFKILIIQLTKEMGYEEVKVRTHVGNEHVGVPGDPGARFAIVIFSRTQTNGREEESEELWGGDHLVDLLIKHGVGVKWHEVRLPFLDSGTFPGG